MDDDDYRLAYKGYEVTQGSPACQAASLINDHFVVWIMKVITIIQCCIGIPATIFVSVRIFQQKIFHINQRILIVQLGFLLCLRAFITLIRSVYFTIRSMLYQNNCDLLWQSKNCYAFTRVIAEPTYAIGYCYLAIALERGIACIFGSKYENTTKPCLGIIGVASICGESLYICTTYFSNAFLFNEPIRYNTTMIVYCTTVSFPRVRWLDLMWTFRSIPMVVCTLLLFTSIYYYSKHRNKLRVTDSSHSLDERFHRRITLKTARIVFPDVLCFTVINSIYVSTSIISAYLQSDGEQVFISYLIKDFGSVAFNFHLILHPILLTWRQHSLWTHKEDAPPEETQTRSHFDLVQSAWAQVKPESVMPQQVKKITKKKKRKKSLSHRIRRRIRKWIINYISQTTTYKSDARTQSPTPNAAGE